MGDARIAAARVAPLGVGLALVLLALAWFCNLDYRSIIKADEGRYAEIAREMVATGDWLTPRLNGFKYFEKPALQHWTTAAAFSVFGINEWTARLWTALTGFLGILVVWRSGDRAFGAPAGLYGAAVLASSALWVFVGHFLSLDMGVAFFMSAAVSAFMLAQLDDTAERARRNWMLAGWAAMALAVLSKGLIGVVLPAAAVAFYIVIQRDWRLLKRLHVIPGVALFLLIAAPWFVAVSLANPEFFRFFFIHEHFERFLTRVHGRYEPAWYFIPVLAAGLMPWLPAALPAAWRGWSADRASRFRPARFLLAWCVVVFVFFSASSSKLPSYVLPMVPAVAMLVGRYLPQASRGLVMTQALVAAMAGVGAIVIASHMPRFASPNIPAELLSAYAPWILAGGCVLAVTGVGAAAALRSRRAPGLASALVLAFGGLTFTQLVVTGHEALSPVYSAYHMVERIRPALRADAEADAHFFASPAASRTAGSAPDRPAFRDEHEIPFYSVNTFDHSVPFYLGRTVTMVAYKDELEVPIGWEPTKFLPDIDAFAAAWSRDRRAYAVMTPGDFELIGRRGDVPMEVLSRDPRRVVVRKGAPR